MRCLTNIQLMEKRVPASVSLSLPEASVTQLGGHPSRPHPRQKVCCRLVTAPIICPAVFWRPAGELVGFDVEMAHILAEDLGVDLQFVPFEFDSLGRMLSSGQVDMAMSCIASLPDRYAYASFSRPYLDLTLAFIVPDHQREVFSDLALLREREQLTIAMVSTHYFESRFKRLLPEANIVYLEAAEDFFNGGSQGADALLLSAEEGSAYSYRYPRYSVARVQDGRIRLPAGYAVPKGDVEMMEFVSNWIDLKRKDGTIEDLYHYWMLGGAAKVREPRWSVIRDVLGWVE